jgi:hypothetical protein
MIIPDENGTKMKEEKDAELLTTTQAIERPYYFRRSQYTREIQCTEFLSRSVS